MVLQEIDSTVGIMRDNINKVSERGARLDSLQDKTDNLAVSAQGFRRGANRVRKQMWWKDMKMRMWLIVGIIILLTIIIVPSGKIRLHCAWLLQTADYVNSRCDTEKIKHHTSKMTKASGYINWGGRMGGGLQGHVRRVGSRILHCYDDTTVPVGFKVHGELGALGRVLFLSFSALEHSAV
jgi:hypothetical protein